MFILNGKRRAAINAGIKRSNFGRIFATRSSPNYSWQQRNNEQFPRNYEELSGLGFVQAGTICA